MVFLDSWGESFCLDKEVGIKGFFESRFVWRRFLVRFLMDLLVFG